MSASTRILARRAREDGAVCGSGSRHVALVYPSPYAVGMSSLGFQTVYRLLNALPDVVAERAFLPDPDEPRSGPLLTYESLRPAADFPVVAFSVAYELELAGLFTCMQRMGLPILREQRTERHPWVVVGGPLTFSNPLPLSAFADIVVMGEAEHLLAHLMGALTEGGSRADTLVQLAAHPSLYVPALHGADVPAIARTDDALLPAFSSIVTPEASLRSMFLVEAERGCSRGCAFCVMRRSPRAGGMRLVPKERVLSCIPSSVGRVGLVGAAVSDHPGIVPMVRALVDRGLEVGLSSLRADRLTPDLVQLLVRGGYRTLTVASDGASERLRERLGKKIRATHLLRAAELARDAGLSRLKIYMMVGVPDETDADLDELVALTLRQAEVAGPRVKVSLAIAPFVAKRNTPLDGLPFAGIRACERRVARLRHALARRVDVVPVSSRWAWVEYMLAQGDAQTGLAALDAWHNGGRFAAWRRALDGPRGREQTEQP